nr:immunoglobulin heavy chain junction region [Macaca mulatta]MOV90804.1 immunoglobulin heavy chain junction region [Macaca mulatta]
CARVAPPYRSYFYFDLW